MHRLDLALSSPLTLVIAPAGSGKTTLVRQWLAERSTQSIILPSLGWVSLEGADNDLVRFWRYVLAACKLTEYEEARQALTLLTTEGQSPFFNPYSSQQILATLLSAFAHLERRTLLVLDDYHLITAPALQKMLTVLIEHLPDDLHLLLITRSQPPLPLARWRARGMLQEFSLTELRFTGLDPEGWTW